MGFKLTKTCHLIIGFFFTSCCGSVFAFTDFHKTQGYRVTSGILATSLEESYSKCVILCSVTTTCLVASFSSSSQECLLSSSWYTDPHEFTVVEDSSFVLLRKSTPTTLYNDPDHWHLVFRAHAKSGYDIWNTWTNTGHHDDDPSIYFQGLPVGCVTVNKDLSCDRFYRSQLLDDWTNLYQVQIAFFTDGVKSAYVTFDASSSTDKNDFIDPSRIVDTSITEFLGGYTGQYNYFSTTGFASGTERRFYLSQKFGGCGGDRTWWVVIGSAPACPWEMDTAYPTFLYTSTGYHENFQSTEPGKADVFAIFVKKSSPVFIG